MYWDVLRAYYTSGTRLEPEEMQRRAEGVRVKREVRGTLRYMTIRKQYQRDGRRKGAQRRVG